MKQTFKSLQGANNGDRDYFYDVITCFEVLEHIDETDILIQNCNRNLRGYAIYSNS